MAITVIETRDDGSQIEFWGYAAGGATYGELSEITLAKRSANGTAEVLRYILVGREPGPVSARPTDQTIAV